LTNVAQHACLDPFYVPMHTRANSGSVESRCRQGYREIVRIDSRTDLVIAADVAKRLGLSAQRVNVLASGPGFPKPLGKLGRSSVWRWSSVERWARETGRLRT
jgi:predicted DNA-binding transcriptional regulator AlpA